MSAEPSVIVSRIGSDTVVCPVKLVAQLQRERQAHRSVIAGRLSEALMADAEHIKEGTTSL